LKQELLEGWDGSVLTLWGGRSGYSAIPDTRAAKALAVQAGWRFAAPELEGRQVEILGQVGPVWIGLALDEGEFLALERPSHLPCGEAAGSITLSWIKERVMVGREEEGLIVFRPLLKN